MCSVSFKRSIDHQRSLRRETFGGVLEKCCGAFFAADMKQVDTNDGGQACLDILWKWPGMLCNIDVQCPGHCVVLVGMTNPCIDAVAVLRIWITRLPSQMGKPLLKLHCMFAASAGDFQNGSPIRKPLLKYVCNGFEISCCGWEMQPLVWICRCHWGWYWECL